LDGSIEDFSSPDDVYDAIGDMLLEVSSASPSPEDDIRDLCDQLFRLLRPDCVEKAESNGLSSTDGAKKLNAPVRLATAGSFSNNPDSNGQSDEDVSSIWLMKSRDMSKVPISNRGGKVLLKRNPDYNIIYLSRT
jgi:ATP-binding cassette subfamily F protein 3